MIYRKEIITLKTIFLFCIFLFLIIVRGADSVQLDDYYAADFNCDKKVSIQDFAILLSRWGQTSGFDDYSHDQCEHARTLDIDRDGNIDIKDFGRLFSCWGTSENESCYYKKCEPDNCNGICPINCTAQDDPDCDQPGCCGDSVCDRDETSDNCLIDCPIFSTNSKDQTKYKDKQVFLISDEDWKNVLSLVPVTTWTDKHVRTYPTLIYHDEDGEIDADSIIHFIEQYKPSKVVGIGDTSDEIIGLLNDEKIIPEIIYPEDLLSYWSEYKDVVYIDSDYELGLLASIYASLENIPLIIKGSDLDNYENLVDRNIICVGMNIGDGINCNKTYHNLKQLQHEYVNKTQTDKIILVNPNDLNIKVEEELETEKIGSVIEELYSKTSLAAPVLASAKHEIILTVPYKEYDKVDASLKSQIKALNIKPEYLTIIAAPNAIDMSKEYNWYENVQREEVDNHVYGNFDNDPFQELAVGRIFSLTSSDVSAYLARDLFYSEMPKDNDFSAIWPSPKPYNNFWNMKSELLAIEDIFKAMGLKSKSFITDQNLPPDPEDFKNKQVLVYADHAWTNGGGYYFNTSGLKMDNVWLNSPMVFMEGCGSCAFELSYSKGDLFCANLLRRGAIFDYGATVDASATNWDPAKMAVEELLVSKDIGQAIKKIRNKASTFGQQNKKYDPDSPIAEYDKWDVLIGDPTFNPDLKKPKLEELRVSLEKINDINSNYYIEIFVPQLNKSIDINYNDTINEYDEQGQIIGLSNIRVESKLFTYPFGNNIGRSYIVDSKIYEISSNKFLADMSYAYGGPELLFSLEIPENYFIKRISDIKYIDQEITKSVKYMPVFETEYSGPDIDREIFDYFYYTKDYGAPNNIYYFKMYINYGGNPRIVEIQDTILPHKFRIYLELE